MWKRHALKGCTLFKDGKAFQKLGTLFLFMFPSLETKLFKLGPTFQGRRITYFEADWQKAMEYKLHHCLASNSQICLLQQIPQSKKLCLVSCAFRLRHCSTYDICIFMCACIYAATRLFFLQARYLVRGILPQELGLSETNLRGENKNEWEAKERVENAKLTGAVAPLLVSIVVGCHGAPRPIVVLWCAAVVATPFVDKRESTAVTRRCASATSPCT